MLFVIARHEFLSLFRTPLGWIILALSQFLLALVYYIAINQYLNKQYLAIPVQGVSNGVASVLFGASIYILLIIVPVLAMRSISKERHQGTLSMLLAAPVSDTSLLFGKFLGLISYLSILLVSMLLMSLTLGFASSLDYGVLISALIGMLLVTITFMAIAFYIASLTAQPALAIAGGICALLFLFFLEFMALTKFNWLDQTLSWLSLWTHSENFLRGTLNTSDVFFYLIISSATLYLTLMRFKKLRKNA